VVKSLTVPRRSSTLIDKPIELNSERTGLVSMEPDLLLSAPPEQLAAAAPPETLSPSRSDLLSSEDRPPEVRLELLVTTRQSSTKLPSSPQDRHQELSTPRALTSRAQLKDAVRPLDSREWPTFCPSPQWCLPSTLQTDTSPTSLRVEISRIW